MFKSILAPLLLAASLGTFVSTCAAASVKPAVYLGLDAEFSSQTSTSDDAIRAGMELAIEEINAAGGVLDGRPLGLRISDNRTLPARGVENVRRLARDPNLVAIFCGKFSPVALELLPLVHRIGLPLMDPWAAADSIVDNGRPVNYVFRLSLRDGWAIASMLRHARRSGLRRVGVLLPNTAWGRSAYANVRRYTTGDAALKVTVQWYNLAGDVSYLGHYQALRAAGAQGVLFVGNEDGGALLIKAIASLPVESRLPLISHFGITGGDIVALSGPALLKVDVSVVQTFSFLKYSSERHRRIADQAQKRLAAAGPGRVNSVVGFAQAYDLVHILAKAIDAAGRADRAAIRDALERLPVHHGLIKIYRRPFTTERHEALHEQDVFIARFAPDGTLRPVDDMRSGGR